MRRRDGVMGYNPTPRTKAVSTDRPNLNPTVRAYGVHGDYWRFRAVVGVLQHWRDTTVFFFFFLIRNVQNDKPITVLRLKNNFLDFRFRTFRQCA